MRLFRNQMRPPGPGDMAALARADEAEWVDAGTVECDFCASLIRSE